jgi:hypothetical protein
MEFENLYKLAQFKLYIKKSLIKKLMPWKTLK